MKKKLKELKASNSWKIGRAITWPVRKLKAILRKFSNGNALTIVRDICQEK